MRLGHREWPTIAGLVGWAVASSAGCGGAQTAPASTTPPAGLDAVALMRDEVLPRFDLLRSADGGPAASGAAPGRADPRRDAALRQAARHFWDAEKSPRRAAKLRRLAGHSLDAATRRATDWAHLPEALLLDAFVEHRAGHADAARRSLDALFALPAAPAELTHCGRILAGEIEILRSRYDDGLQQLRWVIVEIDSALYPLALYRTAGAYLEVGRSADARQALLDVIGAVRRRPAVGREPLRVAAERELAALPPAPDGGAR